MASEIDDGGTYELVVLGSGCAGFAAAIVAARAGEKVLLVGERGDLVWEAGRGFFPHAGDLGHPVWQELVREVDRLGGAAEGWLDGAVTEAVATRMLLHSDAEVLYYARPCEVAVADGALDAVVLATRTGLVRVRATRWIDATEAGELVQLLAPQAARRRPRQAVATLMLQHPAWDSLASVPGMIATSWPTERAFPVDVSGLDESGWRSEILGALDGLEAELGDEIARVAMSHVSFETVGEYDAGGSPVPSIPGNVRLATPSFIVTEVRTLADRFSLGLHALEEQPVPPHAEPSSPAVPAELRTERVDVCVVGAGTGGVFAALAAGRGGACTLCLDPLTFVGGSTTGAGIHVYWFGVPGGLQMEVDRKVHQLMRRYRRGPLGDGPFNPWAKMLVLEQELADAGVDVRLQTVVTGVERDGDRIVALRLLGADGPYRVEAGVFVEATGDGDLLALAGVPAALGRDRDGLAHAYTQTGGRLQIVNGLPRMEVVNIDSGFCDVTDIADITRARLDGVAQHAVATPYTNTSRPTYLAPVLGIREGRRFHTDYMLTLDDQVSGRRFDDSIGYTASNVDTHATDYEFESDELVFWLWVNRQWNTPIACDMSYRMLLVPGLTNVLIGSRCLGATHDAMYATRMQRDIQRVGEVAGTAAALAAAAEGDVRRVGYDDLRAALRATGAITKKPRALMDRFGVAADVAGYVKEGVEDVTSVSAAAEEALADLGSTAVRSDAALAAAALRALDDGEVGAQIWWLYAHREQMQEAVLERLTAPSPMTRWLAASVLAMWGDQRAEPVLIDAVRERQYGFGDGFPWTPQAGALSIATNAGPIEWDKVTPNWVCAVVLLRRCGTDACLEALAGLLDGRVHGINTLTAIVLTLEGLLERGQIKAADAERVLEQVRETETIGSWDYPGRAVGRYSELALRGADHVPDIAESLRMVDAAGDQLRNTYTDNRWQLELAIARCRVAAGSDRLDPNVPTGLRHDRRGYVRNQFAQRSSVNADVDLTAASSVAAGR